MQMPEVTGAPGKEWTEIKVAGGREGDARRGCVERQDPSTPGPGIDRM